MTERQAAFVAAMVAGAPSGAEAARIAGYPDSLTGSARVTASQLLAKPNVRQAIESARATATTAIAEQAAFTAAGILRDLHETHGEARGASQYGPAVSALGRILDHIAPPESKHAVKLEITIRRAEAPVLGD